MIPLMTATSYLMTVEEVVTKPPLNLTPEATPEVIPKV